MLSPLSRFVASSGLLIICLSAGAEQPSCEPAYPPGDQSLFNFVDTRKSVDYAALD